MELLSVGQPQDAVAVKGLFINKVKPAVGVGENCGKVGEIVAVGYLPAVELCAVGGEE